MLKINWRNIFEVKDSNGDSLKETLLNEKVLMVFLRHFGCTYCRKLVTEVEGFIKDTDDNDLKVIFVHMSSPKRGDEFFKNYNIKNSSHISDVEKKVYKAFSVKRGKFKDVLGPDVIVKGFRDLFKFGIGKLEGDGFQMHALYLLEKGDVKKSFTPKTITDKTNFQCLLK